MKILSADDVSAERLDVGNSTVAKWESGRTSIPEGIRADLEALEDLLDAQSAAYLRKANEAHRIALTPEARESKHLLGRCRPCGPSLRRAGVVVAIDADTSEASR